MHPCTHFKGCFIPTKFKEAAMIPRHDMSPVRAASQVSCDLCSKRDASFKETYDLGLSSCLFLNHRLFSPHAMMRVHIMWRGTCLNFPARWPRSTSVLSDSIRFPRVQIWKCLRIAKLPPGLIFSVTLERKPKEKPSLQSQKPELGQRFCYKK